ncbi:hypothetical protein CYJ75_12485 [Kocuria rhizophila]|uniref:DNA polymerase III subunit beta family protein n=1 Tax=Kocuria rhizophila TaxID=72000 RepID=UPI000C79C1B6|nr:hypothetical protein [Kocuria rhizophila]PKZ37083.1 hypothetical protein CYJ75_12485 [Kocuria rhizophila]
MNTTIYSIACTQLHSLMAGLKLATAKANANLPVLEEVQLTVDGERVTGVATDRYRLFMDSREVALEQSPEEGEAASAFTLPASAADDFKRLGFSKSHERARVEVSAEEVVVATASARLSYPPVGAEYPRVGALMVKALGAVAEGKAVEVPTQYNVDYLGDFAKVRRAAGIPTNTPLRMHQIPAGAGSFQLIVTFPGTDFWALLMGVRHPEGDANHSSAVEALERATETAKALASA